MERLFKLFAAGLALLLAGPLPAWAQDSGSVVGTVIDGETDAPLPGANVVLLELGAGAAADEDGQYRIADVPAGAYTLRATYVGYVTTEQAVAVAGAEEVTQDLVLQPDYSELGEVVVTALGIERAARSIGYSAQSVEPEVLERSNEANLVNALAGKIAGVQINSSSGQPGRSARIVIRGNSSFLGNNQPLFVVDGIPISNEEDANAYDGLGVASTPLFSGGTSNRALDIDPSIIEEITVLKGASATALYGSRAANGAIVITTKSGVRGQGPSVTFSSEVRWDDAVIEGYQNQFVQGQNGFYQNGLPEDRGGYVEPGAVSVFGSPVTTPQTTLSWGPHKDSLSAQVLQDLGSVPTFDPRADFYQTGTAVDNNVNFAGGTENVNYFFGVGDLRQEGIVPGTKLNRTNLLAKFGAQLGAFNVQTSVNYIRTENDWLAEGNTTNSHLFALNFAPISFDLTEFQFEDGSQRMNTPSFNNPFWLADNNRFTSDLDRFIASTEISYELLPGLTLAERIGIDTYGDARKEETNIGTRGFPNGRTYDQQIRRREINSDLTLRFDQQLTEDLNLSGLVGNNVNARYYKTDLIRGQDLNVPGFYHISTANVITGEEQQEERLLLSAYGQATFNHQDWVYLTLTGRNDWSSTLPENNRSYFYPSASVGLVFTEALRVFDNTPLDFGKLRASIAQVGNDAPVYALTTNFTKVAPGDGVRGAINYPFNGVNGFRLNNVLGNAELKPETTTEYEVGLDLRFLRQRALLDVAYYNRSTEDQIFQVSVSPATGFSSQLINAGEIRNRGVELTLGGTPVQAAGFQWDLQANFARNRTEVVRLTEGVDNIYLEGFTSPQIRILPDEDGYGVIWGSRFLRNGDLPEGERFTDASDDALLIDDDGFPIVAPTLGAIGSVQPDWTANLRNTFSYKGLSLSTLFDVRRGGDVLNFDLFYSTFYGTAEITQDRGARYLYEGVNATTGAPNTTEIARDQIFYQFIFSNVDENFVEDGSFVKLRELSLSYALPQRWLRGAGLQAASLTAAGRNLWINSDFSYGDPEGSLSGAGNGQGFYHAVTPGTRSYSLGLQLTF